MAKWFATDHAVQCALDAIQVHGAYGYSDEYPVARYLRNSKAAVIYEGTSQLHTLIQADYLLGYREDKPLRCEPWPAQGWERPRGMTGRSRPLGGSAPGVVRVLVAVAALALLGATAFGLWHLVVGGVINGNPRAGAFGFGLALAAGLTLIAGAWFVRRRSRPA